MPRRLSTSRPATTTLMASWLAIGAFATTAAVWASAEVRADVPASTDRCFAVDGADGDAAVVNLTPVRAAGTGNGQLVPPRVADDPPTASNVNFARSTIDPNVAFASIGRVPVVNDDGVCFINSAGADVDLIADHLGTISAFRPATTSGEPVRSVDTRIGLGGDRLAPGSRLCFTVDGSAGDAALVNLTPVQASARGFGLLVSSDVTTNPLGSNVNYAPRSVDPNVALARIGADGRVCFLNSGGSSVHLIADHLGSISAANYEPARADGAPERRVDTREAMGGTRLGPSGQLCFDVAGDPGDAAIVNLTPIRSDHRGGFGLLVSSTVKDDVPVGSNVNFSPGSIDPNIAIALIGGDGQVCFQNSRLGSVDLIADHLGTITEGAFRAAGDDGAPVRVLDTRYDVDNPRSECEGSDATAFDQDLARTLMGLASRAYEIDEGMPTDRTLDTYGDATVHQRSRMSCWVLLDAINTKVSTLGDIADTELIIAQNTQTFDVAVAFRGTEGFALFDWITNLSATRDDWRLPNESGTTVRNAVHAGFADAYRAVQDELTAAIDRHQTSFVPGTRFYFAGHSLGGAIATVASIDLVDDLVEHGYDVNDVVTYTFGAPRALSPAMAGHHGTYAPQSYAVASPMDPVPQVPATALGYAHIPEMTMLNGALGSNGVRLDHGDGRNHEGCLLSFPPQAVALGANFATVHARKEYDRRLGFTDVGAPDVGWRKTNFLTPVVIEWDAAYEGPCDWVGLWRNGAYVSLTKRSVVPDLNDQHTTAVYDTDGLQARYINIFGRSSATS